MIKWGQIYNNVLICWSDLTFTFLDTNTVIVTEVSALDAVLKPGCNEDKRPAEGGNTVHLDNRCLTKSNDCRFIGSCI